MNEHVGKDESTRYPASQADYPPDIETMRATAWGLLARHGGLPRHDDLEHTLLLLHGHVTLLIPDVAGLARALPCTHPARRAALASVAGAHVRLNAGPGTGLVSAVTHAQGLARALRTLCDQYEHLTATAQAGQPR